MELIIESTADVLTIANSRQVRVWKGATADGRSAMVFAIGVVIAGDRLPEEATFNDRPFDVPDEVKAYVERETEREENMKDST